jgi:hypothetical protein
VQVVEHILEFVSGGAWAAGSLPLWVPTVGPSFDRKVPLPADAERMAVIRGVEFYRNARLLPDGKRATQLGMLFGLNVSEQTEALRQYARLAAPYTTNASGDGQLGIFEGLTSDIDIHGKQPQSNGVRCDCVTESSASFAVRSVLSGEDDAVDRRVATNLLNYGHIHSGYHQSWALGAGQPDPYTSVHTAASRPWIVSGDAFGLMSWTTSDHAYQEFFSDDDARGLLGAVATAGLLKSERWHSTIATAVLGNLRATSKSGFAPGSAPFSSMVEPTTYDPGQGWRKIYDSVGSPNFSPHYESYIWAVYLWAYSRSGFTPLLERAQAGLTTMMENYPSKWVPTANGIAMQRARIILPLAFLVRVNDTALHRSWLTTVIDGFDGLKHCEGDWCAYREELSHPGWGGATGVPTSNAAYGTGEAPLNQENSDPVSDFLYTSNFALLGLHEAAAALQNATVSDQADRLANFIVRLQAKSTERPELDGAFMRAFDYVKWENWASDGDIGWGAWSVESGWTQSWITMTLGMRVLNTSLWELGSADNLKDIEGDFATWIPVMFPPAPPPPPPEPCSPPVPCLDNLAGNETLFYTLLTSDPNLCAPAAGSNVSHVIYKGALCGGKGSKNIQWLSMHTVDPRAGMPKSDCAWNEPIGTVYTGRCGSCAANVRLPNTVC